MLVIKDAHYPWLLLVPRRPEACEIIDLDEVEQAQLMTEISRVARALKEITKCDKLNIAALGNVVPQLHVHIIARRSSDVAWPRPVWGVMPPLAHDAEEVQTFHQRASPQNLARLRIMTCQHSIRFRSGSPAFVTHVLDRAAHLRSDDDKLLALESQPRYPRLCGASRLAGGEEGERRLRARCLTIDEALKFGANPGTIFLGLRDGAAIFGMGIAARRRWRNC